MSLCERCEHGICMNFLDWFTCYKIGTKLYGDNTICIVNSRTICTEFTRRKAGKR